MGVFHVGQWLVQFGFHGGRWSVETFLVEYEGEPAHYHRVVYFGPLYLSWEAA
jgi:hypothetical protein